MSNNSANTPPMLFLKKVNQDFVQPCDRKSSPSSHAFRWRRLCTMYFYKILVANARKRYKDDKRKIYAVGDFATTGNLYSRKAIS